MRRAACRIAPLGERPLLIEKSVHFHYGADDLKDIALRLDVVNEKLDNLYDCVSYLYHHAQVFA